MEDLYSILGVSPTATNKEIHDAYIRLIKLNHPDNKGNVERAASINHAYDVLIDPISRKEYDEKYGFTKNSQDQKNHRGSYTSYSDEGFDHTYKEYQESYNRFRQYQEEVHRRREEEKEREREAERERERQREAEKERERQRVAKEVSEANARKWRSILTSVLMLMALAFIALIIKESNVEFRVNDNHKKEYDSESIQEISNLEKKFDEVEKEKWQNIVSGMVVTSIDAHELAALICSDIDNLNKNGKGRLAQGILSMYDEEGILPPEAYSYKKFNNLFTTKLLSTEVGNEATKQLLGIDLEAIVNYYYTPEEIEYKKGYPVGYHVMDDNLNIINNNVESDGYAEITSVKKIDYDSLLVEGYAGWLDTEEHVYSRKDQLEVDPNTGLYKSSGMRFELRLKENIHNHEYSAFTLTNIFFE